MLLLLILEQEKHFNFITEFFLVYFLMVLSRFIRGPPYQLLDKLKNIYILKDNYIKPALALIVSETHFKHKSNLTEIEC